MIGILNNPQCGQTPVFFLEIPPPEMIPQVGVHEYYGERPVDEGTTSVKTASIQRRGLDERGWITDITLAEFVARFPVSRTHPEPIPEWFLEDQQGRELRRAVNQISMDCRRGMPNTIYCDQEFDKEYQTYHGPLFNKVYVDFVPKGYVFLLYENEENATDIASLYDPERGILPNLGHHRYGRLVRIIGSSAPRLPQDPDR